MIEKSDIESCFSDELNLIRDEDLRNKVVEVWKEAAYRGKWKNIDDAPFTLLIENSGKLTDHTKRITKIAKSIFDQRIGHLPQDPMHFGLETLAKKAPGDVV